MDFSWSPLPSIREALEAAKGSSDASEKLDNVIKALESITEHLEQRVRDEDMSRRMGRINTGSMGGPFA